MKKRNMIQGFIVIIMVILSFILTYSLPNTNLFDPLTLNDYLAFITCISIFVLFGMFLASFIDWSDK
jgi:hypothetical protein